MPTVHASTSHPSHTAPPSRKSASSGALENDPRWPVRPRSATTTSAATHIERIKNIAQQVTLNVFDHSPYKESSVKNFSIERNIGLQLIESAELRDIAKKIRALTGSPMLYANMSAEQKTKLDKERNHIGGAKELYGDVDSLDAHVLATLLKAESKEYNFHNGYENGRGTDYIPYEISEKRKCMFNHVAHPENIIQPWNSHRFDLEIYKVTNTIQLPERIKDLISDRWNEFLVEKSDATLYIQSELGLDESFNEKSGVFHILQSVDEKTRRKILVDDLHIPWSTETVTDDENNHRQSNPRGAHYRQHMTGARSNVVMLEDRDDPNVNQWVREAIACGKPVISGPSGHTLRYLNHYAMCKEMLRLSGEDVSSYPSLAEARLVMMANLMPPKNHHSYHEIMLASVGISDGEEMLAYDYKRDYTDLNATDIGRRVWETISK